MHVTTHACRAGSCHTQGGLTWLWLDSPYVMAARKLWNWILEANDKGDTFPVSQHVYEMLDVY
jgi:hypothetical protein